MVGARKQMFRLAFSVGLVVILALQTGCFPTDFTYGKATGQSVNGVTVLANLLRERGHSVARKRRLSKRIDNFDTIIWAPDNCGLPPENVVTRLERWLTSGNSKVLVYIGRSYDGTLPYYRGKFESATPETREQWQRELAEKVIDDRQYDYDWRFGTGNSATAYWFENEEGVLVDSSKIEGPWAEGIDADEIELECRTLLKPIEDYNDEAAIPKFVAESAEDADSYYDYDFYAEEFREGEIKVTDLLTVDGKPFAFELSTNLNPNRKVIIISNASFLLNYPLLNHANRKLASKVADEAVGDVIFLESDWNWPTVGGSGNDPALRWTWVGRAPMRYIVPHFLFWGVLYCFAFFPNFGRPKRVQFHPPKAFRSHVKAVAAILGRSKEKSWARQIVDMWLKRNNKSK